MRRSPGRSTEFSESCVHVSILRYPFVLVGNGITTVELVKHVVNYAGDYRDDPVALLRRRNLEQEARDRVVQRTSEGSVVTFLARDVGDFCRKLIDQRIEPR